jgi:hypothetical protein
MARSKSSRSKASSYEEIGEFWASRGLADYRRQTKPVEFEVELKSEMILFAIKSGLSSRM